jgi:DNA-binding GntR family transcriptional regulator
MIAGSELVPGSSPVLRELAGKLMVSRMPVIKAIRCLERIIELEHKEDKQCRVVGK